MTDINNQDRRIDELRRLLLKPEALAEYVRPLIAEILSEQLESSREEMAQAIAPLMGEALRQAGQSKASREQLAQAIAPVMGEILRQAEQSKSSREDIARAIAPVIGEVFQSADIDRQSREKIARAISPMIGEAMRRIEQTRGLHNEIAQAITPAMIDEALRRVEQVEHSRAEIDQKMGQILNRMQEMESAQSEIGQTVGATVDRLEKVERAQEEISKALITAKDQALASQIYEAREEIIQVLHPVIERLVQRTVSKSLKRMTGTVLIHQTMPAEVLPLPPASPPVQPQTQPARYLWVGVAIILLVLSLALGWWVWQLESQTAGAPPVITSEVGAVTPATEMPATASPTASSTPPPTATLTRPAVVSTLVARLTSTPTATPQVEVTPPAPVLTRLASLTTEAQQATATATDTPEPTQIVATPTLAFPQAGFIKNRVYLRREPDSNVRNFLVLPDTTVTVLEQRGNWYKVSVDNTDKPDAVGWIGIEWVELTTIAPAVPTPTVDPPSNQSDPS